METSHPINAGLFFTRLWLQIKETFTAWHINISFLVPYVIPIVVFFIIFIIFRRIVAAILMLRADPVFLELTPPAFTDKSAYTTQQLFSVLHYSGRQLSFIDRLFGKKVIYSFEIVSTRSEGIRYIIRTDNEQVESIKRSIVSYLPQVRVKEIADYLPEALDRTQTSIRTFKLKKHFAFPLAKQNALRHHDPVAYITGMMTQLEPGELVSFQIVVSPTVTTETSVIAHKILRNEDVIRYLNRSSVHWLGKTFAFVVDTVLKLVQELVWGIAEILFSNPKQQQYAYQASLQQQYLSSQQLKPVRVLSPFEQEIVSSIQEKIDQSLYETSIRALVIVSDKQQRRKRLKDISSSLAPFSVPKYQSFTPTSDFPSVFLRKMQSLIYKKRMFSFSGNTNSSLLSVSEIADLYHFPFNRTTQTENIVKVHSKKLPAPLSLKQGRELQVIFGQNTYGDSITSIGLTKEERETHMYVLGRTGSGKTTLLSAMALCDIQNGEGMAFIDPHGDVSEELLHAIPKSRMNDLIYLNPIDLKYPIGINLLELTPDLDEDEAELEKEVVAEGVISLFRKVFLSDETINPHRIEYILRNTIYTAFTIEDATIFTLYDLLNDPSYRKQVIAQLTDKRLQKFWKNEVGKAGDYQIVKMFGGVTAKIGRFLFSPTASRILEQKHSTINFDEILDQGKILICNFSQGNLGEDTARLLGTTVLTKVQQAALRRARLPKNKRRPFYLYVDEFQNFASLSFIKLLSEGRKYGLSVCIAEQSTSQQKDRGIVNNILANVTTVVIFRSANAVDIELLLTQFAPYINHTDIPNLPKYNFYIKISALESEEPFSGETILTPIEKDQKKYDALIQASRKNNAIVYTKNTKQQKKITIKTDTTQTDKTDENTHNNEDKTTEPNGLPDMKNNKKTGGTGTAKKK